MGKGVTDATKIGIGRACASQPAEERFDHFHEWRMDIEEIGAVPVIIHIISIMHFVEDDGRRVTERDEMGDDTGDEDDGDDDHGDLITTSIT